VYNGITYQFKQRVGDRGIAAEKIWKSHIIPISTKIRLMKALMWPVAVKGGHSERMKKTRLDAFEMKGLRNIPRVSCIAKKT